MVLSASPRVRSVTPLRKSIATVTLSGTLREKLEACAIIGFDGVEIMESDLLTFAGKPAEVRQICDDLGLSIELYQPFRDFESMPEPQRARNLERAERKFDIMQALGTDLILVCSNTRPTAAGDDARAAADLREMAERAARRGLRVGYEALSWGRHVSRWSHAWRIVQQADHPALGIVLDSFHTLALGDDFAAIADLPHEKIFFVQLSDAPKLTLDVLSWSRHFRNFPGQGDLDVTGFTRAVLAAGYSGPLSLEVFSDDFRASPSRPVARDGLRSLVLNEAEAALTGSLPAAPRLDGIEFLEFAVDKTAAAELAAFLKTMGFHHAGRHRSKEVDLYRNGGVNLVLNAEPESAAAEHFQRHGASVCAMALRVDDAARTVARARALLCQDWREPAGEGERRIPAVRAPDGTLIYLVEPETGDHSFWQDDFDLSPASDGPPTLERVDHVVLALPPRRVATYVLFWRAIFGLVPQSGLETADPYGLVQSRALISPGSRVRLVLNASDSPATATGLFVSALSGGGIHHVAFATPDVIATAASFEAGRATLLDVSGNYYDDLATRLPLGDEALSVLRRNRLLYDEDESGGTFRHFFTDAFRARFFFEAVQRDGGYAGFGAANSLVRAAALASRTVPPPEML